jgi:peptidoglycan/xylan/chitin deacetylase (PgdA/CDA1 family)
MTLFVRIALALLVLAGLPAAPRAPQRPPPLRVPILMYHYISENPLLPADPGRTSLSVPPRMLAEQLDYLDSAGFTTISMDELMAGLRGEASLPPRPVVLTFDDGYADFYDQAYPLLLRHGAKATIYIISGRVGTPGYMGWPELRGLAASPLITIGAHTRTHVDFTEVSAERVRAEIAGSKRDIEAQLSITVRHFCYPAGHYTKAALEQVYASGFDTATVTREGVLHTLDQRLLLTRVRVNGYQPLSDLLDGLYDRRAAAMRPARLPLRGAVAN